MSHLDGSRVPAKKDTRLPTSLRLGEAFKLLLISFEKDDLKGWDDSMDSFFVFFSALLMFGHWEKMS